MPIGRGKGFTGLVDLITSQRMTWHQSDGDGRVFETKPLDSSDDPEFLRNARDARSNLIEQVSKTGKLIILLEISCHSDWDTMPAVIRYIPLGDRLVSFFK